MLTIKEFGEKLLETNDLDPVYVLVYHANMSQETLRRWLLAYWCFYHVGTASLISYGNVSEEEYWYRMKTAAGSSTNPRGRERRHFRAKNATKSVSYLSSQGLDRLFGIFSESPVNVDTLMKRVRQWNGFGPWIAFKVADMVDALGLCEVRFDVSSLVLFDSPLEACEILWEQLYREPPNNIEPSEVCRVGIEFVLDLLGDKLAPPHFNRHIGVQEAETILCKWKSYLYKHYRIGEDVEAVRKGLLKYPKCYLNQVLLQAGKRGKLWP